MLHYGTLCRFELLASVDREAREDCPSGRVQTGGVDSLTPMTSGVEGGNSTVMFLEILAAVRLVLSSHWLPFKKLCVSIWHLRVHLDRCV